MVIYDENYVSLLTLSIEQLHFLFGGGKIHHTWYIFLYGKAHALLHLINSFIPDDDHTRDLSVEATPCP